MKKSGFSLIETLVIISIIGILSAMLIPSISLFSPSNRLTGASRLLVSKLKEAQQLALTEQNQHSIRFNRTSSPPSYQLIKIVGSNETVLQTINFTQGQTLTLDSSITNNQIIFSANGSPSSNGNITLSNGTTSKTITVLPSGSITLQ